MESEGGDSGGRHVIVTVGSHCHSGECQEKLVLPMMSPWARPKRGSPWRGHTHPDWENWSPSAWSDLGRGIVLTLYSFSGL